MARENILCVSFIVYQWKYNVRLDVHLGQRKIYHKNWDLTSDDLWIHIKCYFLYLL